MPMDRGGGELRGADRSAACVVPRGGGRKDRGAGAEEKTPAKQGLAGVSCSKSGDTYSRTLGATIGSESLTTVFGMGTGVTFQICSPEKGQPGGKAPAGRWSGRG